MSDYWDLTRRAQKLAMTLSTCGTQADPRNETATAIDSALTAQPDRPTAEVIAEVLRATGTRCGVRDDGHGRQRHIHAGEGDCAEELTPHLIFTLEYHERGGRDG